MGDNVKEKESPIMRRPRFEVRAGDPGQSRPGRKSKMCAARRDIREEMQLHFRRILPRWYTTIRESDVSTKQCATFEKTRCRA